MEIIVEDEDGIVAEDDCNDNDLTLGTIDNDADCDGIVAENDCNDNDHNVMIWTVMDSLVSRCDDTDPNTVNDMDCDGVSSQIDCNDDDDTVLNTNEEDADCDGASTVDDCDDNDLNLDQLSMIPIVMVSLQKKTVMTMTILAIKVTRYLTVMVLLQKKTVMTMMQVHILGCLQRFNNGGTTDGDGDGLVWLLKVICITIEIYVHMEMVGTVTPSAFMKELGLISIWVQMLQSNRNIALNDGSYGLVEHCINANDIYLLQFAFGQGTFVEEIEFYIYDQNGDNIGTGLGSRW